MSCGKEELGLVRVVFFRNKEEVKIVKEKERKKKTKTLQFNKDVACLHNV